jgi:hypothetical protein
MPSENKMEKIRPNDSMKNSSPIESGLNLSAIINKVSNGNPILNNVNKVPRIIFFPNTPDIFLKTILIKFRLLEITQF